MTCPVCNDRRFIRKRFLIFFHRLVPCPACSPAARVSRDVYADDFDRDRTDVRPYRADSAAPAPDPFVVRGGGRSGGGGGGGSWDQGAAAAHERVGRHD